MALARIRLLWRLARPHQWVKNLFVAAPLFFTPSAMSLQAAGEIALAVLAFCLLASGVYALNDVLDRESDARHPSKRSRPVASGALSPARAIAFGLALVAAGLTLSVLPGHRLARFALAYLVLNLAYSVKLKHVALIDVGVISLGFVIRVLAGAELIEVSPTPWIIIMSGLLAMFLALSKRRDDLAQSLGTDVRRSLGGYSVAFLDVLVSIVLGAMLASYLVYTTDAQVIERMGTDKLYFTTPFVILGIARYLQVGIVDRRAASPTRIALTDRFMLLVIVGWIGTFAGLIYY